MWSPETPIPWHDEQDTIGHLSDVTAAFLAVASANRRPWRVLWCAGAGVVATSQEALERETRVFSAFLDGVSARIGSHDHSHGSFFLAASAGGVYGGSVASPPFDEASPTGALSPYGREKLAQEVLARTFAEQLAIPLLIGRISNLYGPGQDLSKPQGLVTHVGRAALRREPISIYVALDTIRDYLLASDAARIIARSVGRLEHEAGIADPAPVVTKIIASQAESSVATVLATWRKVLKRNPRFVLSSSTVGRLQPRVLSFRSHVWPELDGRTTSLLVGVHAVLRDQLEQLRTGNLR